MELQNSFTVPSDIDTAWRTLLDVANVAPCMPGGTLESVEGDSFTGSVKVKLGPVMMVYGGQGRFVTKDASTYTAVIDGTGKETRGTGTAKALVTTSLVAEGPDLTRVHVSTDLTITGKAAQFGRGVMQDVAGRIIDQFAGNLAATMAATSAAAAVPATPGEAAEGTPAAVAAPTPVVPQAADSIDLLGTAGAPVLKRALPVLIGVALVVGVIIFWARRRS